MLHFSCFTLLFLLSFPAGSSAAPDFDPSKIPPAANKKIDFDHDIKPIFDSICLRCHGPERPKSHFRLDNRDSALKGGDNGIDIIPGDGSKSPLVHYVARVVPDMEMPPPGKGEPLTATQVGLFRAWIDQGALWGGTNVPERVAFSVEPLFRWIAVDGDQHKFREVEGVREGFGGGLEHFLMEQRLSVDKRIAVEGRALFPEDDFQIKLSLEKADWGFVRAGFEQWRRYYDDAGGYYQPYATPSFSLARDLHLDIGRAWVDFGLNLPRWPQIVLGYEYQFRDGAKSTLEWGAVPQAGKNIYPAAKDIHEHAHVLKLDITHEVEGWRLEDNARMEFYKLGTRRDNAGSFTLGPMPDTLVRTSEGGSHVQGMNTLRIERQVQDWWLVSGGYFYSRFDGDASMNQVTVNVFNAPVAGRFWSANDIMLRRETHIFSLANLALPVEWLSASVGVQSEWTRQEGFGNVHLDSGDPNLPDFFSLYPGFVNSDLDRQKLGETASVRFTKLPFAVLFGEARFEQESIGQYEQDEPSAGVYPNPKITFLRNTDYDNDRRQLRAGFNTSPWKWIALNAHYQKRSSDSDYEHTKIALDPTGYSAFIRGRKIDTDEAQTKLLLHPVSWLKTTLTYKWITTEYSTTTDPVPGGTIPEGLRAGNYQAHVYGINATLTPFRRWYFSGTFNYSETRTRTAQNGNLSVVPYEGNVYTIIANASYVLSSSADLQVAYSYSNANYGQNNIANGLPLGLDYNRHSLMTGLTWRWNPRLTTGLRYAFFKYSEPSSGGFNDYMAHGVFATVSLKWL